MQEIEGTQTHDEVEQPHGAGSPDTGSWAEYVTEKAGLETEHRQKATREALGKFNFFIHVTGYVSGCAYLLILGLLIPEALPYVFIPIGLWTAGLAYHCCRAFRPGRDPLRGVKRLFSRSGSRRESDEC